MTKNSYDINNSIFNYAEMEELYGMNVHKMRREMITTKKRIIEIVSDKEELNKALGKDGMITFIALDWEPN